MSKRGKGISPADCLEILSSKEKVIWALRSPSVFSLGYRIKRSFFKRRNCSWNDQTTPQPLFPMIFVQARNAVCAVSLGISNSSNFWISVRNCHQNRHTGESKILQITWEFFPFTCSPLSNLPLALIKLPFKSHLFHNRLLRPPPSPSLTWL